MTGPEKKPLVRRSTIVMFVIALFGETVTLAASLIVWGTTSFKAGLITFGVGELIVVAIVGALLLRGFNNVRRASSTPPRPTQFI